MRKPFHLAYHVIIYFEYCYLYVYIMWVCGCIKEISYKFSMTCEVSCNSVIAGYARDGCEVIAFELSEKMEDEPSTPNSHCIAFQDKLSQQ